MRWLIWATVVAACGGDHHDGATLIIRAPDGPASTAHLELVLANADPATIVGVDHQRVVPTGLTEASARYYRQRATAGALDGIPVLDGFELRIEPNAEATRDTSFVPFLLAHDFIDNSLILTGVGTVLDENGDPTTIDIEPHVESLYFVDMQAVTLVAGDADLAPGDALEVDCPLDNTELFRSGIAWQPPAGPQLRLMLPDLAADRGAFDATPRALDLDCDMAVADAGDCDDLRAVFHAGATETCDGRDTDCNGRTLELIPCALPAGTCGAGTDGGVSVCDDTGGVGRPSECRPEPSCACAVGSPGPCSKCVLTFEKASDTTQTPCAPAVDAVTVPGCSVQSPCTVEVVDDPSQPWRASVSKSPTGPFTKQVTAVTDAVQLRLDLTGGTTVTSMGAGSSVGGVFLFVDDGTTTSHVGVDVELTLGGPSTCAPQNGVSAMQCN